MGWLLDLARGVAPDGHAANEEIEKDEKKSLTSEAKTLPAVVSNLREVSIEAEPRHSGSRCKADVPSEWLVGFEQMQLMRPPDDVPAHRWQTLINDVNGFLDCWAAQASELGWASTDLFGCDRIKPLARLDRQGLCWLTNGRELFALTGNTAAIRTHSGRALTFYRRTIPAGGVLAWELVS